MPIEDLAEESLAKNPNLELAQYLFTLTTESRNDDAKLIGLLMESIKENNMAPFYEQVNFFSFLIDKAHQLEIGSFRILEVVVFFCFLMWLFLFTFYPTGLYYFEQAD